MDIISLREQLDKVTAERDEYWQVITNYHDNPEWLKHHVKGRDYSFPEFVDNIIKERDQLKEQLAAVEKDAREMVKPLISSKAEHLGHRVTNEWFIERDKALSTPTALRIQNENKEGK